MADEALPTVAFEFRLRTLLLFQRVKDRSQCVVAGNDFQDVSSMDPADITMIVVVECPGVARVNQSQLLAGFGEDEHLGSL